MPFTAEELSKIRQELPRGYSNTLAKKFNMTPASIRNVLSGYSKNDEVVLAAFALAKERKLKIEQTKTALQSAL